MTDYSLIPIGYVESSIDQRQNMKGTGVPGTIIIYDQYLPALSHLDENSHIIVQCLFHKAKRSVLKVYPRKFGVSYTVKKGVFATRSPDRPNPISITVTKLLEISNNKISVERIDAINGTPVIDIKPYSIGSDNIFNTHSLNKKTDFINPTDTMLYEYIKLGLLNYIYKQDASLELGIYSILKLTRSLNKMPDRETIDFIKTDYTGNALDSIYYYSKFTPGENKIILEKSQNSCNSFLTIYLKDGSILRLLIKEPIDDISLNKIVIESIKEP